jgi:plasmid rolling circle replication initiator protein Rep
MTGLEVLGAVSASLQLVQLATKAVKLFSDMRTGFKDADGKAALVHQELVGFKQSAEFAYHNLSYIQADDVGLKQSLLKYEDSISQLGHKMQTIQAKKKLLGRTEMWMKLMSRDSDVNMLRRQLEKYTSGLMWKFTVVVLKEIKGDVSFSRSTRDSATFSFANIFFCFATRLVFHVPRS